MKKTIMLLAFALAATFNMGAVCNTECENIYNGICYEEDVAAIDTYWFTMQLSVPRIYDNLESLGYRKYQTQKITGQMHMLYDAEANLIDVKFTSMVNKTHKMSNGAFVTYDDTHIDKTIFPRFNAIGSNKKKAFKTASICFYLAAQPNYSIGEFDEDNALYVVCAGNGKFSNSRKQLKSASGKVAGTLGCGCTAYGHLSPTRQITYYGPSSDADDVDDVAAVFGIWKMKYLSTKVLKK